jgi:Protein of unknown function (DUF3828)
MLLLFTTAYGAPKVVSPETVVTKFYKYHFSHDMAFTQEALKHRSAWFTPELLEACRVYFAIPENPDEPPYIEGDPFTGSQEYPNRYSVGKGVISDTFARVPVIFTWKEDGHSTKGEVVLKNLKGKWLIDDVEFPDQDSVRKLLTDASKP